MALRTRNPLMGSCARFEHYLKAVEVETCPERWPPTPVSGPLWCDSSLMRTGRKPGERGYGGEWNTAGQPVVCSVRQCEAMRSNAKPRHWQHSITVALALCTRRPGAESNGMSRPPESLNSARIGVRTPPRGFSANEESTDGVTHSIRALFNDSGVA